MSDFIGNFNIEDVIKKNFPNRTVKSIKDKGTWIKRVFEVSFYNEEDVVLKFKIHPEWGDVAHEVAVEKLFNNYTLPAPSTLVLDSSCEISDYPYIIQKKMSGIRLDDLIKESFEIDRSAIYESIGHTYRKMHEIKNNSSGLWIDDPKHILYPISPNEYMFQAEILKGSGRLALQNGKITTKTYDRIINVWETNMRYLKEHQPVLIHGSPFIWTISLNKVNGYWEVTKLMSLSDVMWWDAAYDIAFLCYPPFSNMTENDREAFKKGYGILPERKRILLYVVIQRLCSGMGVYMEPDTTKNKRWRSECFNDIENILDEIESI